MGIMDKINTKVKNMNVKKSEKAAIRELGDKIEAEEQKINVAIANIGEYYWNLYSKNALVPEVECAQFFQDIVDSLNNIDQLNKEINDAMKESEEERERNLEALKEKEERQEVEAEIRNAEKNAAPEDPNSDDKY